MAAAFTRKLGSLLANYSLSTLVNVRTKLVNFAIFRYLPAITQVSQPFFLPICLVCVLSTAGQKAQHGGPLPPLNPAHTGGERAAKKGQLVFVLPGRGPELQSVSEVVLLLSVSE